MSMSRDRSSHLFHRSPQRSSIDRFTVHQSFGMADHVFRYKEGLLEECAQSVNEGVAVYESRDCKELFSRHQDHFQRPFDSARPQRYREFLKSVEFVFDHNEKTKNDPHLHSVRLNRFSDQIQNDIFLESDTEGYSRRLKSFEKEPSAERESLLEYTDADVSSRALEDWMAIGKGSLNHLRPHGHMPRNTRLPSSTLRIPVTDDSDLSPFQVLDDENSVPSGALLTIKMRKKMKFHSNMSDPFVSHLNWASTKNPDGVPIVNEAFDQESCGSCWAFAAAGSVEASAARLVAFDAYRQSLASSNETVRNLALTRAREAQMEAFGMLNLSVQELLDCDTEADQGCVGGNPLLAFYYIHRYGLTSWDRYPYTGTQGQCQTDKSTHPIASVKAWGIIPPNFEKRMELVLRYVGPIAAGINGADRSFLSYGGGIFNSIRCKQSANHAVLIVGYGEETVNNVTSRYWIARNSWGRGWGHNGFIKILRSNGKKGTPGVCGIARSANVALGGILLRERASSGFLDSDQTYDDFPLQSFCSKMKMDSESVCGRLATWVDFHKAASMGLLGIIFGLVAMWPLTRDYRRRRERRRRRSAARRAKEEQERLLQPKPSSNYGSTK